MFNRRSFLRCIPAALALPFVSVDRVEASPPEPIITMGWKSQRTSDQNWSLFNDIETVTNTNDWKWRRIQPNTATVITVSRLDFLPGFSITASDADHYTIGTAP